MVYVRVSRPRDGRIPITYFSLNDVFVFAISKAESCQRQVMVILAGGLAAPVRVEIGQALFHR